MKDLTSNAFVAAIGLGGAFMIGAVGSQASLVEPHKPEPLRVAISDYPDHPVAFAWIAGAPERAPRPRAHPTVDAWTQGAPEIAPANPLALRAAPSTFGVETAAALAGEGPVADLAVATLVIDRLDAERRIVEASRDAAKAALAVAEGKAEAERSIAEAYAVDQALAGEIVELRFVTRSTTARR